MRPADRVPALFLAAYVALWLALAWKPHDRLVWVFESILPVGIISALALSHRRFAFSLASYLAMFAFAVVHAIGAHYGYTHVPIPWESWGFSRNHSDRIAHASFGLLVVIPVEEILRRVPRVVDGWREAMAIASTFALSAGFEVVEWVAVLVGGDAIGPREGGYLGTQGDQFDAVKDMGLGLAGAAITMGVALVLRRAAKPAAPPPLERA